VRSNRFRDGECHGPRDRVPDGGPTGFTLAETVLALGITATLVATLVPVCVLVAGTTLAAHDQSMSTMLAVARLEQLRGLTFTFDEAGGAGAIRVTDTVTDVAAPVLSGGGRGLSPSPGGALLRDTEGFVDYLDASGRWVGCASPPPATAIYVRRWAITPLPASPDDAVVLQVLVTTVAGERRMGPRVDGVRRPGDVWLALLRARAS